MAEPVEMPYKCTYYLLVSGPFMAEGQTAILIVFASEKG
jgi:hypothetical protein